MSSEQALSLEALLAALDALRAKVRRAQAKGEGVGELVKQLRS